jgi:methyl-accepting chemotaxis protein
MSYQIANATKEQNTVASEIVGNVLKISALSHKTHNTCESTEEQFHEMTVQLSMLSDSLKEFEKNKKSH